MSSVMIPFAHGNFIKFTSPQLERMRDMYVGGHTLSDLAGVFGIDEGGIRRRLMAMGVKMRKTARGGGRYPALTDEQCLELHDLIELGMSTREAAKRYGCTPKTISSTMHRARYLAQNKALS